jgi:hypothetical protein
LKKRGARNECSTGEGSKYLIKISTKRKKKTDGHYDFFLSFFLLAAQRVIEFLEIPFKKQNFIIYTQLAHSGEGQL